MSTGTLSNSITILPPNPAEYNTGFFSTNIISNGPGNNYKYASPSPFNIGVFSGDFDSSLNISWNLSSWEEDSIIKTGYEVAAQDSFSGFSINVYMTTGNFSGYFSS